MPSPLLARLQRAEAFRRDGWAAWLSRPLSEWPDDALALFVCDVEGIPAASAQAALAHLSDEVLEAIARRPDA